MEKKLLGERVYEIAKKNNIPRVTVETIIRGYLESLVDSALQGEVIVIDNIASVKVLRNENNELSARCRISSSLSSKLSKVKLDEVMEDDVSNA